MLGPEIVKELATFAELDREPACRTLGDYTLRRQFGRGGMGVVYEAWQSSMDRVVALKVLPPGVAADNQAFHRFMREAKTAGQLNHQNVVAVYSTGVEEGTPWYSMEYVEGETLAQTLARCKREGEAREGEAPAEPIFGTTPDRQDYYIRLADAFADVADGLQHAHSKGVVHRDIKPSNLILDSEGRLRILDFGLARLEGQESLTLTGDFVGTPAYMSPEQAKRRKIPVDHRTDIYSLGATLYELLTHEQPFRGKDHQDTLSQIIERDPRPPRQLNPRVPADLETIVLKCLRKDPGDRYGTAEALGQDLRRFVRGDPIEARPEGTWERTGRRLRRHRNVLLAAGIVLLLTTTALIVSHTLVARARDRARYDLYVSNMRLAMEVWEAGDFHRFVDILEEHIPAPGEPDLRGWEWYYLASVRDSDALTISPGAGPISALDWSPDGRRIALGTATGALSIREASTWEKTFELSDAEAPIRTLAWSPGNERLAIGTKRGTLTVYEGSTGDKAFAVEAHPPNPGVLSIAWSPDGTRLASAGSGKGEATVHVWSLSGQPGKSLVVKGMFQRTVAWSPDGSMLALAHSRGWGDVVVWDTATWERLPLPERQWHQWRIHSTAWSPDGDRLATGGHDQRIYIWDSETWEELPGVPLRHRGIVFALAFSPDGRRLASAGGEGIAKVWDLEGTEEPLLLRGHVGRVTTLDWNPDGRLLATGGEDGTVRVWNSRREPGAERLPGEALVAWSPDGRWLAAEGEDCLVDIYDASSGIKVSTLEIEKIRKNVDSAQGLAFSPDARLLAVSVYSGNVEICR